jgi:hypothetical protein
MGRTHNFSTATKCKVNWGACGKTKKKQIVGPSLAVELKDEYGEPDDKGRTKSN